METTDLVRVVSSLLSMLLPLLGMLGYLRVALARIDQKVENLESSLREHIDNMDAHITRDFIRDLDKSIGGPTDQEWGQMLEKVQELRHDMEKL